LITGSGGPPPLFIFAFGAVLLLIIGTILFAVFKGLSTWTSNNAAEVISTRVTVVSKRTKVSGGVGDSSASTNYYITFEFTDRNRTELSVRGKMFGLIAEGDCGILTFQGTRFHGFQRE
jgi:hypothetical protein